MPGLLDSTSNAVAGGSPIGGGGGLAWPTRKNFQPSDGALTAGSSDGGLLGPAVNYISSYLPQIQGFEGFTPRASWDYKQYTNGYGTRAQYPGEVIDRGTANQRFTGEIGNAQAAVEQFAPNAPPGVKAALTSLTFNAGNGWMKSGLGSAVQNGDYDTAKNIFLQYNRAGGVPNDGLTTRRQAEAQWFGQSGASPSLPGRMSLGAPLPSDSAEDDSPMPGGLLSSGANMARYSSLRATPGDAAFPPSAASSGGAPITTGSINSAGPTAPAAAGPGGLLGGFGDKLTAALQNPLFQFGVGMAGAGGEGKGIGGGLLGGAQNANAAYKAVLDQYQLKTLAQRQAFIQSLSDPNNPLSRALSPQLRALMTGLSPEDAIKMIAPTLQTQSILSTFMPGGQPSAPAQPQSYPRPQSEADVQNLPAGTLWQAPDGSIRRR